MESDEKAVNRDAATTSSQFLHLFFIVMISFANLGLLVQQAKKKWFYNNVKSMIICSLAIGDLILALFPLIVMAAISFGHIEIVFSKCHLFTASATYQIYLIHFVYGIGLITLGAEVFLRHRIYALRVRTGIVAFLASAIPWILGVVIILPLCLVKVDFESTCANYQSVGSMYGVSVFFPTSLAVVVTVILNFVNFSLLENSRITESYQPQVVYHSQPQHQPSHKQQINPTQIKQTDEQPYVYEQGVNQYPINQSGVNQYPSNQPGVNHNHSHLPSVNQYPSNQSGVNQYPSNLPSENQYPSNQPGVNQYPSNQPGVNQYPSNQPDVNQYPSNQPGVNHYTSYLHSVNQYPSNQPGVSQYPRNQSGVNNYPSNQTSVQPYPSNKPDAYEYSFNPPGVYQYPINEHQTVNILVGNIQTTNMTDVSLSNRKKEVQRLLIISVVFFILVVPQAVVSLNIRTIEWPDQKTYVGVTLFLYWLMTLRSFVTPLIMLTYSDL